jgi:hypothetical protein
MLEMKKTLKTLSQNRWSPSSDFKLGPPIYEVGVLNICTKPEIKINMEGIQDTLQIMQVLVVYNL